MCKCVLYYCHRVSTQIAVNKYIISFTPLSFKSFFLPFILWTKRQLCSRSQHFLTLPKVSPGLIVAHKLFRHPGTFSSVHCALQIVVSSLWMAVTCQVKGHDLVRRNVGSIGCRTLLLSPPSAWILIPVLNCQVESGRVVTKETWNNYRREEKRVLVSSFPPTFGPEDYADFSFRINPLNPKLNPICYLLALLAHHFLHVSRIRVKSLTIRLLMSYIYGAPILDVSRSYTTTHHSR